MLEPSLVRDVLDAALATGGDFAELFMEDRRDTSLILQLNRLETVNSGRIHGAGVRVYVGLNAIYAYTNDTSREGLIACARQAASAVRERGRELAACAELTLSPVGDAHPVKLLPSRTDTRRKADILRAANAAAREAGEEIVQVVCTYCDSEQDVLIANSEGRFVTDRRVYTRLGCQAVAGNGTENQSGFEGPGALMGFELFESRVDPARVGREAARTAIEMLHAPVCPSGVMPVAIGNGFGGVIFHEACGHGLEATSVAFGTSVFCGKLGEQIRPA